MVTSPDVTVAHAAKEIGVTPERILQWIHSGELKASRFGNKVWQIPRNEVDRMKKKDRPAKGRPRISD